MTDMADQPTLHIKILSPKQVVFDGPALSLSSINSAGNFDILPGHANFLTLAKNAPIVIRTLDQKRIEFSFALSIIYNNGDEVRVYTDIIPSQ
jgi:F0F1-type ATP synthase epsilon subunit